MLKIHKCTKYKEENTKIHTAGCFIAHCEPTLRSRNEGSIQSDTAGM